MDYIAGLRKQVDDTYFPEAFTKLGYTDLKHLAAILS